MKKYDLVVVGSGAGLMVIDVAVNLGLKCALIEKSKFGGTCLTKGCIPSKMLVYPADLIRETERAAKIGLKISPPEVNWDVISKNMWEQINYTTRIEKGLLDIPNLDVYKGVGEFTSKNKMVINYPDKPSEEITADKFVIAAGGRSFVPDVEGLKEVGYVTSESFFGDKFPKKLWKSVVILGGGAISSEFAHILSSYGVEVTVVLRDKYLLRHEEEEVSEFLKVQFENNGVKILEDTNILSVKKQNNNKVITLQKNSDNSTSEIECEEIFVATGIKSNSDLLKPEKAGIEVDKNAWIITNEYLETNQKNIWAIGDINGKFQFRHKANYEAEVLIRNVFGSEPKKAASYDSVPWTIFTNPQVAHVGMTEREVKEKGIQYRVGINHYSDVVGGIKMGYRRKDSDNGFVKLIVGVDHKILGAHVVGPQASILLQPYVYLMNAGGTYLPIKDSMVIHPSLNELTAWVIDNIEW